MSIDLIVNKTNLYIQALEITKGSTRCDSTDDTLVNLNLLLKINQNVIRFLFLIKARKLNIDAFDKKIAAIDVKYSQDLNAFIYELHLILLQSPDINVLQPYINNSMDINYQKVKEWIALILAFAILFNLAVIAMVVLYLQMKAALIVLAGTIAVVIFVAIAQAILLSFEKFAMILVILLILASPVVMTLYAGLFMSVLVPAIGIAISTVALAAIVFGCTELLDKNQQQSLPLKQSYSDLLGSFNTLFDKDKDTPFSHQMKDLSTPARLSIFHRGNEKLFDNVKKNCKDLYQSQEPLR